MRGWSRYWTGRTDGHKEKARIQGLPASANKRQAAIHFSKRQDPDLQACLHALAEARQAYWQSFISNRSNTWGA